MASDLEFQEGPVPSPEDYGSGEPPGPLPGPLEGNNGTWPDETPAEVPAAGGAPADPPGMPVRFRGVEEPYSKALEQALLGELLVHNSIGDEIEGYIKPEHFYFRAHAHIFQQITVMLRQGRQVTVDTLTQYVASNPDVLSMGGHDYLQQCYEACMDVQDWRSYADDIRDYYMRRCLNKLAKRMLENNHKADPGKMGVDRIEDIERELYALTVDERDATGTVSFKFAVNKGLEEVTAAYKSDRQMPGLPTGFKDLDSALGGLHAGDLIVLAARPGMGKTALANNIAANIALPHRSPRPDDPRHVVQFFSLEMTATQLAMRIVSARTEIKGTKLRYGTASKPEMNRLYEVSREIENTALFIDDDPIMDPALMRTRARRLKRREGRLDLIIVDYLQLMAAPPELQRRNSSRVEEVSQITRALKGLAKELEVPVLALSQLSRAVELREDKTPKLADLRDSGSIEQDADVVLFLYRPVYYESTEAIEKASENQQEPPHQFSTEAYLYIAKHRQGPTSDIGLYFEGAFMQFRDYESPEEALRKGERFPG